MALSHAKLRLSKLPIQYCYITCRYDFPHVQAIQDDALLAVLFYEECLVGRFSETLYAVL